MLFSLLSTALSSLSISASPLFCGPVAPVPPTPALFPAEPVVMEDPDELAVPALLVPGGGGDASFDELPAPLGSLPELFSPPAFAGPEGTPLTPAVPAPAEPALGEPTALPLPADGPLAAPPALPPPAPPALCALARTGEIKIAIAVIAAVTDVLVIGVSFLEINDPARCWFPCFRNDFRRRRLDQHPLRGKRQDRELRKLIEFDDDTFAKLKQLGRDRMATIQELADEAFADVLKKHGIPIDLKDALRKSAATEAKAKAPAKKAAAKKR
jgi:hypothetical protein